MWTPLSKLTAAGLLPKPTAPAPEQPLGARLTKELRSLAALAAHKTHVEKQIADVREDLALEQATLDAYVTALAHVAEEYEQAFASCAPVEEESPEAGVPEEAAELLDPVTKTFSDSQFLHNQRSAYVKQTTDGGRTPDAPAAWISAAAVAELVKIRDQLRGIITPTGKTKRKRH